VVARAEPRTVLVVDDEADLRDVLRLRLESDGRFSIIGEADDGVKAIDMAAELQPDVVLLDLLMPGLDGREALPGIVAAAPTSMIVIFSAVPSKTAAEQTTELGAFAYLEKTKVRNIGDNLEKWLQQFDRALDGEDMIAPLHIRKPSV